MTAELHTRRTALTASALAAGSAVGLLALSACGSDSPSGTPQNGAPETPLASGQALIALADIPVGQAKAVTVEGKDAIISRTGENTAVAFSAICTHQGCKVAPAGADLNCPCHGSVFNAATGAVKKGPADKPLPSIAVKVENGQVLSA